MPADHSHSISNYYFQLSHEPSTVKRAFRTSIIVGIVLNFINHYQNFVSLTFKDINPIMVVLTFLVPYLVSTFSSVASNSSLKPGKISSIDGLLQCKNCKMVNFKAKIGDEIEECGNCHKKTKWRPLTIISTEKNESDMLKSLALFARHNPQPLFRVDESGIITGANPSSEILFKKETLNGENIKTLISELSALDISRIIRNNEKVNYTIIIEDRIFDLTIKGISSLSTLNIYANEITQIIMAENKIKEQARNISDSIVYASRIQMALLPEEKILKSIFPECFVFYKPKNVVSGDFYWANELGDLKFAAVADCTGHGVPGAFMSMLGISLLNEIILREHVTDPGDILNILRERIILSLSSGSNKADVKDGMDISLAVINTKTKTLLFSGAFNPMYICRNGKLLVLEADRMPVGKHFVEYSPFSVKIEKVMPGDRFFLFSDGFKDQFGGVNNKKFSSGKFKDFIIETDNLPFDKIFDSLQNRFDSWKLDKEQVDDVLVMGIKIDR
ncbi:MAG TPA: nitrate/nitrite transporter NrtS [Bacteroidales bacterium]|nr:nitrate/nitrite transporter NrtS [Bacteroidales bacterium]